MRVLGIDPGARGGVALIANGRFIEGIRTPLITDGKRDLVDTRHLTRTWAENGPDFDVVVIEKVHSMPAQGVASTFTFGRHTGAIEGWAIGFGLPVLWTSPQSWKKRLALSSSKRASLDAARLYFGDDKRWDVLANDGVAEAALIALDWYRQFGKTN